MTTKSYLKIKRNGTMTLAKRSMASQPGEIVVELRVTIPNELFDQMIPRINLELSDDLRPNQISMEAQLLANNDLNTIINTGYSHIDQEAMQGIREQTT